jgi:hypothetical protein
MKNLSVKKMTRLAILLALGVILNYLEHVLLPTSFIAPGVNWGWRIRSDDRLVFLRVGEFVMICILRVVMTPYLRLRLNFFIALAGWGLFHFGSHHRVSFSAISILWALDDGRGQPWHRPGP